jgi:Putative Actinobacterial Holin-X, holin superfamily III
VDGPNGGAEQEILRERPIGEVARDLTKDLSLLVRQEAALAKAELREKAQLLVPGIAMFGGALVLALAVVGALTATLILVLATFLDDWLAALAAALLIAAIALALVQIGRARIRAAGKPVPEQTIETVKEDVEWAKTRATSARK